MRRSISIFFAILMLGLSAAAPAFAQGRDPFEPQPGDETTEADPDGNAEKDPFDPELGEADPAAQEDPNDPTDPVVDPTSDPDPVVVPDPDDTGNTLSNTGADVTTWGGIGYVLVVLGIAAIVAARTFAPVTARRRR